MRHRATPGFWAAYKALPGEVQRAANKQYEILRSNPSHPSLGFKKIGELRGRELWSARITLAYRAIAAKKPDGYVWFWIGGHSTYEKLLSSGD